MFLVHGGALVVTLAMLLRLINCRFIIIIKKLASFEISVNRVIC